MAAAVAAAAARMNGGAANGPNEEDLDSASTLAAAYTNGERKERTIRPFN